MAIFGNFKGTTTSEFKIGKKESGSKISTGTRPSTDISTGDIFFDSANATLDIYETSWKNIGETAGLPPNRKSVSMKWDSKEDIKEKYDIYVQFLQTYEGVEGDSASIAVATSVISSLKPLNMMYS